jgi:Lar family restriction alleviation protein
MAYTPGLKPCPFCGSEEIFLGSDYTRTVQIGGGYTLYNIRCSNCNMETGKYWDSNQLVSKWQTRSKL